MVQKALTEAKQWSQRYKQYKQLQHIHVAIQDTLLKQGETDGQENRAN